MEFNQGKIRAFIVGEIVGKLLARVLPGIMLYVVINQTLQLTLPAGNFISGLLIVSIWWLFGFCMEFYNRRIPFMKKLYAFNDGFDTEKMALSILFTNIATGALWTAILFYSRAVYREGINGIYFGTDEVYPYELHVLTLVFVLIFLGMVFLWRRDSKH